MRVIITFGAVFGWLLLVAVTGCATLWMSQEERLRQRVVGFWEALKAGDLVAMYDYEELSRDPKLSLQKYVQGKGAVRYLGYEIKSIRLVNPKEAEVTLAVEVLIPPVIREPIRSEIKDFWVRIGNTWYHARRKPSKQKS